MNQTPEQMNENQKNLVIQHGLARAACAEEIKRVTEIMSGHQQMLKMAYDQFFVNCEVGYKMIHAGHLISVGAIYGKKYLKVEKINA